MSLKAVVGQRKFKLFPNSIFFIELLLNLRFPLCCLGIMQDVIRENKKPNEWKVRFSRIIMSKYDVYIRFVAIAKLRVNTTSKLYFLFVMTLGSCRGSAEL